jgi:hypothetical protein
MSVSIYFSKNHQGIIWLLILALLLALLASCAPAETQTPDEGERPSGFVAKVGRESLPTNTSVNDASNSGGTATGPFKPVGFVNHGTIPALVMAWTYVPQGASSPAIPSDVSTVSFPPNVPGLWPNPSRFLSLPLGTYTWCYDWELGDINADSMTEYAHMIDERPVTLDELASDDPNMAVQVDINIPPETGVLPGRCFGAGQSSQPTPTATPPVVLNIWDFIVSSGGTLENYGIDTIGMVHLGDQVVLRGSITIRLRVHRHEDPSTVEIPVSDETIQISAGETWSYYLEEASSQFPGNWDASIQLISIDQ